MLRNQFNLAKNIRTLVPWVKQKKLTQPRITYAKNEFLYSGDKRLIDFTSGLMVVNLGHNNKYILDGFKNFQDKGISYVSPSFSTYERDKLSDRLCDLVNYNNGKVFYTNGVTDANEVGMFIANQYANKKRILAFNKSFHGASTVGSALISGDPRREKKTEYYQVDNFQPIIKNPSLLDDGLKSLENFKSEFAKGDVAGIIVEGSSGSAGCILYPNGYLEKLEKLCRENGILIICDEVMSRGRMDQCLRIKKLNFNQI